MTKPIETTLAPMTDLQKQYIIGYSGDFVEKFKKEGFLDIFNKESKKINELFLLEENLELIPKNMRSLLNLVILEIPYSNLFPDSSNNSLETYNELCLLPIEKMEWGVMQKASKLVIGVKPELFFESNEFSIFSKAKECFHSTDEKRKYCTICNGTGLLKNQSKISEEVLKILFYNKIVNEINKLDKFIVENITKIKEDCINIVWNSLESGQRFTINQEIAKMYGKQPIQKATGIIS